MDRFLYWLHLVKNNAIFIDIGANIGYFTATSSPLGEHTISYEAFYENAGVIMSTIEKNIWRNQSTIHMNTLGYKANFVTIESTNVGINLSNMQIIGIQCASKMPNAVGGIWTWLHGWSFVGSGHANKPPWHSTSWFDENWCWNLWNPSV